MPTLPPREHGQFALLTPIKRWLWHCQDSNLQSLANKMRGKYLFDTDSTAEMLWLILPIPILS